ncbi:shikimate dehydrogenase [Thermogemmatispora carboxidivorans]|uniref:shikimate dehydrogenase n=1 Tax=Thermogemmatispora carboxidivorans TaxID=1382306 RepID=UPI00069C8729|nr:shikimate dehydrogenase [Thermogemmatispora carboxidivorans]
MDAEAPVIEQLQSRHSRFRLGLIGDPVAHSLSPRLQQAALDALGIDAVYELWPTPADELASRVARLLDPLYLGANVTIPHKQAVLPLLDIVDPLAARIGAVNTIVPRDGYLHGHNTDAPGLLHALRELGIGKPDESTTLSLTGYTAIILGAGGAARAAAFALASTGIERLIIVNRHLERAQHLAAEVGDFLAARRQELSVPQVFSLSDPEFLIPHPLSLIINATPVGMHEDLSPLPGEVLARFGNETFVFDMIYNPAETKLLCQARTLGMQASNGLPMLLHQGALAFTLWTGQPAPLEVMRAALAAE